MYVPCSSANPFIGTREVPVTNCSRRACNSLSNDSTACHRHVHCITLHQWEVYVYLPKPFDNIICFFVSLLVDGISSPIINIDLTQSTHKVLSHITISVTQHTCMAVVPTSTSLSSNIFSRFSGMMSSKPCRNYINDVIHMRSEKHLLS